MTKNQWIKLISGPAAFTAVIFMLQGSFGFNGAAAMATAVWMALWWILRPVSIAVTSLLPIVINAVFSLIPSTQVISQYHSRLSPTHPPLGMFSFSHPCHCQPQTCWSPESNIT